MNWSEMGSSYLSGTYQIIRNTRGRFDLWYYGKESGPVCIERDVEQLQRAKDQAEMHKKSKYFGVAVDEKLRG